MRSGDGSTGTGRGSVLAVVVLLVALAGGGAVWVSQRGTEPPPPAAKPSTAGVTLTDSINTALSGVVRIENVTCDPEESGSGSGFLIAPDLVVTVAHVAGHYRNLSVRGSGGVSSAVVVGHSGLQDVALLRLRHPLEGHLFRLVAHDPAVGSPVAILGYPAGEPLTSTAGTVGALHRRIDFERRVLREAIQVDAAASPGSSGGPLIDRQGRVIGLLDGGDDEVVGQPFAVGATSAAPLIAGWRTSPRPVAARSCDLPTEELVTVASRHAEAPALAAALARYFGGINEGDDTELYGGYEAAWATLSGEQRGKYDSFEDFRAKQLTSAISSVVLERASFVTPTEDRLEVRFVSEQDADHGSGGQTCSRWHLRYTMNLDSGRWTIEGAKALGVNPVACD